MYEDQSQLLTTEGFAAFLSRLKGSEGGRIANEAGINPFDFSRFIESLANAQLIVFHGWVEQNKDLQNLLEGKEIGRAFEDKKQFLQHRWAKEFRAFVSPYIVERLLKESTEDLQQVAVLLSYCALIVEDDKATVEGELFKPIIRSLERVKHTAVIEEEKNLIAHITPLCADEIIASVNHLSKGSYHLKVAYVDAILEAIRGKGCTVRYANWILKKMGEVELNKAHLIKLNSLRIELQTGKLSVQNHGEGRTPFRWKNSIGLTLIGLIVVFVCYIIYFKPFNDVEEQDFKDNASFRKFTVDDRMTMDSLIDVMNNEDFTEQYEVDPGIALSSGGAIGMQTDYKNTLMKRIQSDFTKDAILKDYYAMDSCESAMPFKAYPGTSDLRSKTGGTDIVMWNNSEYDVILFVSLPETSGKVYSTLIKKQEKLTFKMDQYDVLTTVAGNTYREFEIPDSAEEEEIPSIHFNRHFCNTDANYYESLSNPMQLIVSAQSKAKLLIKGAKTIFFEVLDVDGVMQVY